MGGDGTARHRISPRNRADGSLRGGTWLPLSIEHKWCTQ
ncbi:hypothetical protein WQQ_08840 [Hydrocarboniphaga effusa AP103]|uniref:Uncharacterized protein n=1 Tax=Hydrocarboniphaga effusa AP103 TaxID=1172194 RepID=I7ZGA0_9GAMM|nr:hypothetical protein WQQ_08840 [Hydrocarboniphaga effusa AP103]